MLFAGVEGAASPIASWRFLSSLSEMQTCSTHFHRFVQLFKPHFSIGLDQWAFCGLSHLIRQLWFYNCL
jgi:hypothetical protein